MCNLISVFLNKPAQVVFWSCKAIGDFLTTFFFARRTGSCPMGLLMGAMIVQALRRFQLHGFGDLTQVGTYAFLPAWKHIASLIPSDINALIECVSHEHSNTRACSIKAIV